MTKIVSRGYFPEETSASAKDLALFCENADLLLSHRQRIIINPKYFFCSLAFAYCSWPYVSGDGPLNLGTILLGYERNVLTASCENCGSKVLITNFGGSILSGNNKWDGFCPHCKLVQSGRWDNFSIRFHFICRIRKSFYDGEIEKKSESCILKEFDRKKNFLSHNLKKIFQAKHEKPLSLRDLIQELLKQKPSLE